MDSSPTSPDGEPSGTNVDDRAHDDVPPVVRRAPFSDNPNVGARGQRTQQRILDAALRVFGEDGYHSCSIDRIATVAGCSRVSFYQYFSGKEDVFRHVTGQVASELTAATEALDPVTPDEAGWIAVRTWVGRYAAIYERYEPAFRAFDAAAETDAAVAAGSERNSERRVAIFRSRLTTTTVPPRRLDTVVRLLQGCQSRTHHIARILRAAVPDSYERERVDDALADIVHRSLFGLDAGVNVHGRLDEERPPAIEFGPAFRAQLQWDDTAPALGSAATRTLEALVAAGRTVFVAHGYHRTRVDDIVSAAGVSHGAFYRYFKNKDDLAQLLTMRAMRTVSTALADLPDATLYDGATGSVALRRWLRHYSEAYAGEAAVIRVWVDAGARAAAFTTDTAAALDWGRRRTARVLHRRGFGDADLEAVVMLAMLDALSGRPHPSDLIEATAHIIERGLLGR